MYMYMYKSADLRVHCVLQKKVVLSHLTCDWCMQFEAAYKINKTKKNYPHC